MDAARDLIKVCGPRAGRADTRRYSPPMSGDALSCKANISPAGRRQRIRFGRMSLVVSIALLVGLVALRAPWYWRLLLFIPASMMAVGFLQARRNTCIRRAAEGTLEHDDFSMTKAPDDEVAASRAVAGGIRRDMLLVGLLGAAIGVATAAIR
jgi:hypothetical protein